MLLILPLKKQVKRIENNIYSTFITVHSLRYSVQLDKTLDEFYQLAIDITYPPIQPLMKDNIWLTEWQFLNQQPLCWYNEEVQFALKASPISAAHASSHGLCSSFFFLSNKTPPQFTFWRDFEGRFLKCCTLVFSHIWLFYLPKDISRCQDLSGRSISEQKGERTPIRKPSSAKRASGTAWHRKWDVGLPAWGHSCLRGGYRYQPICGTV